MNLLLELALAEPWAITERYFRIGLTLAGREGGDVAEAARLRDQAAEPLAAALNGGQRLAGTRTVTVRDGVALVPMIGALFPHAAMVQGASSPAGTSFDTLGRELELAHASPDVRAILFLADTPGGQVSGTNVFAEQIFALRGKGKPIEAYVTGMAASGGYWTMSQCDRITLDDAAAVGSIGVALAYIDDREKLRRDGVRAIELVSSNAPNKRPDLTSDDGLAVVIADLDRIEATFIDKVARGRGLTADRVRAEFGRGGLVRGIEAVNTRMADAVEPFDAVLARLARTGTRPVATIGRPSSSDHGSNHSMTTQAPPAPSSDAVPPAPPATEIAAAHPAAAGLVLAVAATASATEIAAAFAAAHPAAATVLRVEAATAERGRVLAIQALARNAADARDIVAFVADPAKSAADAATALIAADKLAGNRASADLAADAVPPLPSAPAADGKPQHDPKALADDARALVATEAAAGRTLSIAAAVRRIVGATA